MFARVYDDVGSEFLGQLAAGRVEIGGDDGLDASLNKGDNH